MSKAQEGKGRHRGKTTEYSYLLERKAFRMMRRFYKEQFEHFSKSFRFKHAVKTMDPL